MGTRISPQGSARNYCTDREDITFWFAANAGSDPTSFGGAGGNLLSVARTAAGLYTATIQNYRPDTFIAGYAWGNDNANADDTRVDVQLVTITNTTSLVTVRIATRTAAGVNKDIAANAASLVKVHLSFKMNQGNDGTGL